MTERYPSVLLFGAPGVGKGTQGSILGMIPGFFHMSTGDMFRSLDRESELGRIFHQYSSRGLLVPDETTVSLWRQYMRDRYEPHRQGPFGSRLVLLDGVPRNLAQAELMDGAICVRRILHFVAPDLDALVERLRHRAIEQGRSDDADERVIRHRYEVYQQETAPVLAHYDPALVVEIDALDTPLGVLRQVIDAVEPIAGESACAPVRGAVRRT